MFFSRTLHGLFRRTAQPRSSIKNLETTSPSSSYYHLSYYLLVCCCSLLPSTRSLSSSASWFGFDNNNNMPFTTQRNGDGTITVSPKNEAEQSALVVISHGLGDSSEGFVDVAEFLAKEMPHVKFILPTAPVMPVTLNGGMRMNSWYDIVGLDERSNEKCHGIEESRDRLVSILHAEHEQTGLEYRRMVLAGFSQGGALSLYTGLQNGQSLAGIAIMSGYLPAASKVQITQPDTLIWHGHGTQDMVVPFPLAEKSKQLLLEKGLKASYTIKSYPIAHTVSMDEIGNIKEFLQKVLPPDETCRIRVKDPSNMSVRELKAAIKKAGLSQKAVGFMEKHEFVELLQAHRDGKL